MPADLDPATTAAPGQFLDSPLYHPAGGGTGIRPGLWPRSVDEQRRLRRGCPNITRTHSTPSGAERHYRTYPADLDDPRAIRTVASAARRPVWSHDRSHFRRALGDPREARMFGSQQIEHDRRYEMAGEFTDMLCRLWGASDDLTLQGEFWSLEKAFITPKPRFGRASLSGPADRLRACGAP